METFGAVAYLLILVLGVAIVCAWIVLPFKVVNRLDKIVEATERCAEAAEKALVPKPKPEPTPEPTSTLIHPDPDIAAHIARKAERSLNYEKTPGINTWPTS